MKKIFAIALGIMLLTFVSALVFAESPLDVATPKAGDQQQEQPSDQTDVNAQSTPGNVSISKRNKAKLELEQQKKLKQEQIQKEKAAETAPQQ
jgi:biopolymer transport protein ExbD